MRLRWRRQDAQLAREEAGDGDRDSRRPGPAPDGAGADGGCAVTSADVVALVLVLAIAAYACGGGIDYGAGFWDLTAGGEDRGTRPRALVDYAMAPVWEANNVWLVFVLILTWTGFPQVFEAVMSTAWVAVILAGVGLVLRGAGFALRKPTRQRSRRRRYTAVFGVASILAPFFFAATLGGVASGRIPVGNRAGDPVTSWLNPTSVLFGALAVTASAFLAAVFLISDARRYGAPDLEAYFRRRTVLAAGALVVVAAVGLIVFRFDARHLFDGLLAGWGLAFLLLAVAGTAAAVWLVRARQPPRHPADRDRRRRLDGAGLGHGPTALPAADHADHPGRPPATRTPCAG